MFYNMDAFITDATVSAYWRDKDYGDACIEDWYFTMKIKMSNNCEYEHTFWCNNITISDSIKFGFGSGFIQLYNGYPHFIQGKYNGDIIRTPFDPSSSMSDIINAFMPYLKKCGDTYQFNFECPADMHPWEYTPPTFKIHFNPMSLPFDLLVLH